MKARVTGLGAAPLAFLPIGSDAADLLGLYIGGSVGQARLEVLPDRSADALRFELSLEIDF